jgi:hypothetical protein
MIIRANKSQCIYIQKSIKQKHGHTSPHDKMKLWKQDLIPSAKSGSFDRGNQTPFIFRIASSNRELAISLSLFWPCLQCGICSLDSLFSFLQLFTILGSIIISFTLKIFDHLLATSSIRNLSDIWHSPWCSAPKAQSCILQNVLCNRML